MLGKPATWKLGIVEWKLQRLKIERQTFNARAHLPLGFLADARVTGCL